MLWMLVGTAEFVGSTGQGTAAQESLRLDPMPRLCVTSEPGARSMNRRDVLIVCSVSLSILSEFQPEERLRLP
jgi:hypothetical protein